jgi:phosphatidylserine/phosphatidylglycerophosphate/cardiolipin synthase-like enzyme
MKYKLIALVFVVGLIALLNQRYFQVPKCSEGEVSPVFSPSDSEMVFNLIGNAKYEIKLEVYEFSSRYLADALISAKERGISVKVILEPSVYQNSGIFKYLINNGIDVSWASTRFQVTHSKFMIVDDSIVLVGSMNWSENALKNNREASVIIYSKELSKDFERIFDADFIK